MTKQGLFQNHKDGWISGNLLTQLIRKISTAPKSGQQGPPSLPPSSPAFPKEERILWAKKTCPVFLLPIRPHFGDQNSKIPCPNGPKPISRAYTGLFPASIPFQAESCHQRSIHPKAWEMAKVNCLWGDDSVVGGSLDKWAGASIAVYMRHLMVWDGAGVKKRRMVGCSLGLAMSRLSLSFRIPRSMKSMRILNVKVGDKNIQYLTVWYFSLQFLNI